MEIRAKCSSHIYQILYIVNVLYIVVYRNVGDLQQHDRNSPSIQLRLSQLWHWTVLELCKNLVGLGSAWTRPVLKRPAARGNHFYFKWTKAALSGTNCDFATDLVMGLLTITRWEMFDFVLLILPTEGMWSSLPPLCTHAVCSSLFPHTLICSISYRHNDFERKIQRGSCWCLRSWLNIRPRGHILMHACLVQTAVINFTSVKMSDLQVKIKINRAENLTNSWDSDFIWCLGGEFKWC